jgi:hypothetical protein
MAAFLILLSGCIKKKEMKNDLSSWLETHFPGQLVIVENVVNLDLKNLYYKKTSTIVADKNDPEAQIMVTWFKQEDGLGINKEEIQSSMDDSRRDIAAARKISGMLKEKGLSQFSTGVIEMAAYILLYEDPTLEKRKQNLQIILSALDALPDHEQTSIWIEWMEPVVRGEYFNDIIPFGYWKRGGTYHEDKKILSLDFEWSPGLESEVLNTGWAINTGSERAMSFKEEAYMAAVKWAEKNVKAAKYIEKDQMIAVGPDEDDPMAIQFDFPYFESKPDTEKLGFEESALGYINVSYQVDRKEISNIKASDSL